MTQANNPEGLESLFRQNDENFDAFDRLQAEEDQLQDQLDAKKYEVSQQARKKDLFQAATLDTVVAFNSDLPASTETSLDFLESTFRVAGVPTDEATDKVDVLRQYLLDGKDSTGLQPVRFGLNRISVLDPTSSNSLRIARSLYGGKQIDMEATVPAQYQFGNLGDGWHVGVPLHIKQIPLGIICDYVITDDPEKSTDDNPRQILVGMAAVAASLKEPIADTETDVDNYLMLLALAKITKDDEALSGKLELPKRYDAEQMCVNALCELIAGNSSDTESIIQKRQPIPIALHGVLGYMHKVWRPDLREAVLGAVLQSPAFTAQLRLGGRLHSAYNDGYMKDSVDDDTSVTNGIYSVINKVTQDINTHPVLRQEGCPQILDNCALTVIPNMSQKIAQSQLDLLKDLGRHKRFGMRTAHYKALQKAAA